jgi:hypothetical protein
MPEDLLDETALFAIHQSCWDLLEIAGKGTEAGWRLPVLATHSAQGSRQRTIVLRAVQRIRSSFLFHTDIRSAKVNEIRNNPQVSLLFYDHDKGVQLSVKGEARICTSDGTADLLWESGTPASLKMYSAPQTPGTKSPVPDSNLPEELKGRLPNRDEILSGRTNFCVIEVEARAVEWLRLSRDGNLRAEFLISNGTLSEAHWLTP